MKVQIFEQFQGGHYTNYIQHLLPSLVKLADEKLIDEIVVTITQKHYESKQFQQQLASYSEKVHFDPSLPEVIPRLGLDPRLIIKQPTEFTSALKRRAEIASNLVNSVRRIKPDFLISTTADTQSSMASAIKTFFGMQILPKDTHSVGIIHYGYSGTIKIKDLLLKNPSLTSLILKTVRKAGFDIISGTNSEVALLSNYGISIIFDVGANIGQYAMRTRALGYKGKIVSFEPVSSVFSELSKNAKNAPLWTTLNFGCGNYDGEALINISENSQFSSILNQVPSLNQEYPESAYVGQEKITIHKIDSIFSEYHRPGEKIFLKIDTQGFEKNVLEGANSSLEHIIGIQLELSFVSLYEGEVLMMEMIDLLLKQGFTIVMLEPLSHNLQSGKLSQANGIFFRL
jgi:FkbM family methyltransferase